MSNVPVKKANQYWIENKKGNWTIKYYLETLLFYFFIFFCEFLFGFISIFFSSSFKLGDWGGPAEGHERGHWNNLYQDFKFKKTCVYIIFALYALHLPPIYPGSSNAINHYRSGNFSKTNINTTAWCLRFLKIVYCALCCHHHFVKLRANTGSRHQLVIFLYFLPHT